MDRIDNIHSTLLTEIIEIVLFKYPSLNNATEYFIWFFNQRTRTLNGRKISIYLKAFGVGVRGVEDGDGDVVGFEFHL